MSVDYPVHVNFIYPDYSIYLSQGSISTFDSIVLHRTRSRTQINGGGGVVPDMSACPSGCMLSPEVPVIYGRTLKILVIIGSFVIAVCLPASLCPSILPSIHPSVHPSIHLSIHPSVHLPTIHPFLCPLCQEAILEKLT